MTGRKNEMVNGFFDIEFHLDDLSRNGDPLVKLKSLIPWESFREGLNAVREKERKSHAGRKPFDVILMLKILVLQSLYNLSDDAVEYQVRDRLSFMRFLDLSLSERVPDAKTIWLFRENLKELDLIDSIFKGFDKYLREQGFIAQKGQIVDASLVSVPKQRNTREENEQIKQGNPPQANWSVHKLRQKDVDARWTQKGGKNYYGYKNHIQVDVKHKIIRNYAVTAASVHDKNVFLELLDQENTNKKVYADSAYRTKDHEAELYERGFHPMLQRKGCKNKSLTTNEKKGNHTRAKIRCRIEHVFGIQIQRAGSLILRTIGIARAEIKIGLRNFSYNLARYCTLRKTMA